MEGLTPKIGQEGPLVSIVTPSYNMAGCLKETIESVLSQNYPRIEYIVMDGGSRDGTLAILEGYQGRLRYVSTPDGGAADAINRGFQMTHGSIFAWLNADDTFLPGAIATAVRHLSAHPEAGAVYGEGFWVDRAGKILRRYPTLPYDRSRLERECFICQPTCFLRSSVFREAGLLDASLVTAYDYDLWIRIARRHRFQTVPDYLATSRMHKSNKTLSQRGKMFREVCGLLKRHYSYVPATWIYGHCVYLLDGRDQFFEPFHASAASYAISLPVGWCHNWRHPRRYWRDWFSLSEAGRRSLVDLLWTR